MPFTKTTHLSDAEKAWDLLIAQTGMTIECSDPKPHVTPAEKPNPTMPANWIAVEFDVTLRCGTASASIPYRMGTGHVDFRVAAQKVGQYPTLYTNEPGSAMTKEKAKRVLFSTDEQHALNTLAEKPLATLRNATVHAAVAAKCAKLTGLTPTARDVLSSMFLDARDAFFDGCTFEDWCGNTGYDTDSRKAEKLFNACRDTGAMLVRLLGRDVCEQFLALEGL